MVYLVLPGLKIPFTYPDPLSGQKKSFQFQFSLLSKCLSSLLGIFLLASSPLNAQNTCLAPVDIAGIPFSSGTLTTCGSVNDYPAGSYFNTNYGGGEDYVFSLTISSAPVTYQFSLGGTATWKIASVHNACPPTTGNAIGGVATSSGSSAAGNVTFTTTGVYYIFIDTWPAPDCGGFTLDITLPPPPPVNDECVNATAFPAIPTNSTCATLSGNTNAATQSQVGCTGTADEDIWYSFVATANAHIIELTTISGSSDRVHQVFSGTCGALTSLTCSDPETSTTSGLTIGQTYYVRVYTWGSGTFSI